MTAGARLRAPEPRTGARILGVGAYRPVRVVDNDTVAAPIGSSDDWIRRRTGIVSRRFADEDETIVSMAGEASRKALAQSGVPPAAVDLVLLCSMSNLEQSPPAAPRVAHQAGASAAGALDIDAGCAGFCYALGLADAVVRAGTARHVLVVGSERMSDIIDPADRGTAFLFGDGAGAVVVGPATGRSGIGPVVWGSEGEQAGLLGHDRSWLAVKDEREPWPVMRMVGPEVFRWATRVAARAGHQALEAAGIDAEDLAAFVPHQANARIVDRVTRSMKLPADVVVARDVVHSGNTSAASVPLALDTLLARGELPGGGHALLVAFGAGLTYAAQVVELP